MMEQKNARIPATGHAHRQSVVKTDAREAQAWKSGAAREARWAVALLWLLDHKRFVTLGLPHLWQTGRRGQNRPACANVGHASSVPRYSRILR